MIRLARVQEAQYESLEGRRLYGLRLRKVKGEARAGLCDPAPRMLPARSV